MSYCVNCGVELHETADACALCHTPVLNPNRPVDQKSPPPYPPEKAQMEPVSQMEAALLLSSMLLAASIACGILNLFLFRTGPWSLYIAGACVMLWIFFVPPLLVRRLSIYLRLLFDALAVSGYVLLIALARNGLDWYLGIALPIIAVVAFFILLVPLANSKSRRSFLTTAMQILGSFGVLALVIEFVLDRYFHQAFQPSWSIAAAVCCAALVLPLLVIRRVPNLRQEVRKRFHH